MSVNLSGQQFAQPNLINQIQQILQNTGLNASKLRLEITEGGMMSLARQLGVDVTAEGVETIEQLALLKALECEFGQGYLFSKPLSNEAAQALIVANLQF